MDYNIQTAAQLIVDVYKQEGCNVGGIGHIVFDDYNVDDDNIEFCIGEAEKPGYDLSQEAIAVCLKALEYLKGLTPRDRFKSVKSAHITLPYVRGMNLITILKEEKR